MLHDPVECIPYAYFFVLINTTDAASLFHMLKGTTSWPRPCPVDWFTALTPSCSKPGPIRKDGFSGVPCEHKGKRENTGVCYIRHERPNGLSCRTNYIKYLVTPQAWSLRVLILNDSNYTKWTEGCEVSCHYICTLRGERYTFSVSVYTHQTRPFSQPPFDRPGLRKHQINSYV